MQGFERMDGELLDGAVGQLVPAGSMFAFLAAHRADVFPDADYSDLFAAPGVAHRLPGGQHHYRRPARDPACRRAAGPERPGLAC